MVNFGFDDNKTRFGTNDYISSVLDKKISKVTITKTKSSQRKINKKKKTSKRNVFQDLSFIGSLCKFVSALGLSCITLLVNALK